MFTALIALMFVLIVSIVLRYTGAADVSTSAEIENTAPTVDTIRFSTSAYGADDLSTSGILPNIGADRTIHINGQITDLNGESDIASSTLSLMFYHSAATAGCTEDKNDCYFVATCDANYTSGDDTQIAYDCPVSLAYWVDATDSASIYEPNTWLADVFVEDVAGLANTNTATIEVNSLLALNLPDGIDYGTRALGEQSSSTTNVETVLTQRGNTKADVEVLGTTMSCSALGTLPIDAQAWSLTDTDYASGTTLTGSFVPTLRNINLRTDDANELTASLYWNIAIPASGVKGTCTGSNTIVIVAQPIEQALLLDGRLQNVHYTTGTRSGFTGSTGNFIIEAGETYTFSIGGVTIGTISYDSIPTDRFVFLQDLLGLARTNTTDTGLVKRAQFIQSLATETNLTGATVLTIPTTAHTRLGEPIDFSSVSDATLQAKIDIVHSGRTLRTATQAQEHMNDTLTYEGVASSYTVTAVQGANTTISPASRTVASGNTTSFTVSANSGYTLSVSGCGGTLSGATYTTGAITANCTVTTSATAQEGTITQYGTVAYAGGPYDQLGTTRNQGGYYRTVTIGTQTWFKENLNLGTMITGTTNQTNNSTLEKYCYSNSTTRCANDGALYQWNEAMQYSTTEGAQGICPNGWHIPTDAEWKTLEIFLGMTQAQADATGNRGTDQGTKLKVSGSSGFDAVLAGYRDGAGAFNHQAAGTLIWSSTISGANAWRRSVYTGNTTVIRYTDSQQNGFSVRCLQD